MKQDLSLNELFQKVSVLSKQKRDYLLPTNELKLTSGPGKSCLSIGEKTYMVRDRAAAQLASIAGIPYSYYKKLEDNHPYLLDINVNTLLAGQSKNRFVRTLNGYVRAILSDRYRKIEHEQVLSTILPIIDSINGLEVVSASLTEDRLYLKAICKYARSEVKVGDSVAWGLFLTNSETGCSSIVLQPFAMVLKCTNGMVLPQYYESTRRIHLGKQITAIEQYDSLYASVEDNLPIIMKEQVSRILDSEYYKSIVEKMKEATQIYITDVAGTMAKVAKLYGLSDSEVELITYNYHLAKDTSLWGLVNAITETSKTSVSYERAHALETIGSQLLYYGVSVMHESARSNPLLLMA